MTVNRVATVASSLYLENPVRTPLLLLYLGGTYSASPIWDDGSIYFLAEQGVTMVIAPGPTLNVEMETLR